MAWYLPADRGGVMHAHHAVVSALIEKASYAGLDNRQSIPVLSGILADFLRNLISLAQPKEDTRESNVKSSESLERNIIGGPVHVEKPDVLYPHFLWHPRGWEKPLPLLSASSMVSELAPVSLYLRHYVEEGDLLILEEPEAHLHPALQVKLIKEVAKWVRAGIRVILTTHSEWVLDELSNLVAADRVGKKSGLGSDEVGLWFFEKKSKGSRDSRD